MMPFISPKALPWLLALAALYACILAAIALLNLTGADRSWLGALNLYLPQALWAAPGIVLAVLLYGTSRAWVWLPLLCVLWVLGPIMGSNWSIKKAAIASPGVLKVRVMTWNIKYGKYDLAPLITEINRYQPDLILFQDAYGFIDGPAMAIFHDWHVRAFGQYVIASRHQLSEPDCPELPFLESKNENLMRCRMFLGPLTVTVYNVHLQTPREGLNELRAARRRPWYPPKAIETFKANISTRMLQASTVFDYLAAEQGPVILAGDLNAPDSSQVCRLLRMAGLHDAFAEGGTGFGYTYGQQLLRPRFPWLRAAWMRIDHIMMSRGFVTERCWTGTGEASDHRPVIADLVL